MHVFSVFLPHTSKQVAPKGTAVIPVPEGRMRFMEQQYSSSLEANLSELQPKAHKKSPFSSPALARKAEDLNILDIKISKSIVNDNKNPFDEAYDESKNPFADEKTDEPTNPFSEDDDYDKNLNPFA